MMKKDLEFITQGDNVAILEDEFQVTTLKQAVGMMALSLYHKYVEFNKMKESDDEKTRLEIEIGFQSQVLNSMSNALSAVTK